MIYLDGNSLGPHTDAARAAVLRRLDEWRDLAIGGWTRAGWLSVQTDLGDRLGRLLGAEAGSVVVCNSTTVNLHQLLTTLHVSGDLLIDDLAFPSDGYAAATFTRRAGVKVVRVRSRDGYTLDEDDLIAAMTPGVGVAVLPAVLYASGQLLDLPRLVAAARGRGVLIGLDCSHSAGVVDHRLDDLGPDFAFGCTYKYLNGGPGAPGWLYLPRRHWDAEPGLGGWFGVDTGEMFEMNATPRWAEGAARLQVGTPSVLALAAVDGGLAGVEAAGIAALRSRSLELTADLMRRSDEVLGWPIATPREPARRGGHVALRHPAARELVPALAGRGIVTDFREPDVVRIAPVPLFNDEGDNEAVVNALLDLQAHRLQSVGLSAE